MKMKKKNIKKTQQLIPETEPLSDEVELNFEGEEQLISAAEFLALIGKSKK